MAVEGFNFSCTLVLPNGSSAEVRQTDIQRGARQDMTFFVQVRPHAQKPFTGALHLSGISLTNLEACPGDTSLDSHACRAT
jgi:hypothetical protein